MFSLELGCRLFDFSIFGFRTPFRFFVCSFVRLFVCSFVRSFVRSFVCSFVRCSFVRSSSSSSSSSRSSSSTTRCILRLAQAAPDPAPGSTSMFFVLFSFDASVLKNKNNISEVNYDDHCCSGRRNSPSLMLLAFFSTDASKQNKTTTTTTTTTKKNRPNIFSAEKLFPWSAAMSRCCVFLKGEALQHATTYKAKNWWKKTQH